MLILFGPVAWAHDFVNDPALNAAFELLSGASFAVNGPPIAHNSALTSAGAKLFLSPTWMVMAMLMASSHPSRRLTQAPGRCVIRAASSPKNSPGRQLIWRAGRAFFPNQY